MPSTLRVYFLLALIVLLSLWPFWGLLATWPTTMDAVVWIQNGQFGSEGWREWIFETSHFNVGYRPLTALSYTLCDALGGPATGLQRALDLAAHVTTVLLIFALTRSLFPKRPIWTGLLPVLLFVLHPSVDEVLPYLARRAYSLSTVCLLAALIIAVRSLQPRRGRARSLAALAASVLLFLGFFLHEVTIVGALLIPLLGGALGAKWRKLVKFTLPAVVLLSLAWYLRGLVVDGIGGYTVDEDVSARALPIFGAFWKSLFSFRFADFDGLLVNLPQLIVLVIALPYYLWQLAAAARRDDVDGRSWLRLALFAWALGYALLYAGLKVWFPRQAYMAVIPVLLFMTDIACETLFARRGLKRILHLAPQLTLCVFMALPSPVLQGTDANRTAKRAMWNATFNALASELDNVEEAATVRLVLPFRPQEDGGERRGLKRSRERRKVPRAARMPVRWAEYLAGERQIEIEEFVFFEGGPRIDAWPKLEEFKGRFALRIPEGLEYYVGKRQFGAEASRLVWTDRPALPVGRNSYVFVPERDGGSMLALGRK